VGAQDNGWHKGSTEPADDYTFFHGKGNANHHFGNGFQSVRHAPLGGGVRNFVGKLYSKTGL